MKKQKLKNKLKRQKGITLIALVVTIIVLIILAVISINLVFNEGGIISKAEKAKEMTERGTKDELDNLNKLYDKMLESLGDEKRNIKIEKTITEEKNAYATTVTLNISLENETSFTLDQKKNIAAYLWKFSDYNEMINLVGGDAGYESFLERVNLTEENFMDMAIQWGRKFIKYSDIQSLEDMGVNVISVVTPYNTVLYTSSLGGDVKCSFNKNGTYNFKIRSGATEKTETVTIKNIRTAAEQAPYAVKLENPVGEILYSVDNQENWQLLTNVAELQCNDSIYVKFADFSENEIGTSEYKFLHYVEKGEEYFKYFNDESNEEWIIPRYSYAIPAVLKIFANGANPYQRLLTFLINALDNGNTEYLLALKEISTDYLDYLAEADKDEIKTAPIKFPSSFQTRYPSLYVGLDETIGWSASEAKNGETSPILKIDVTHDMNLLLCTEIGD